ncbi:MAG TPA: peptide ABC transporter substrate-binding protein [Candidatus Paceibacterota bacterium]|nr:peptide ABC transporter substrate-binding protein [Candidatus Paceibacterota bacterium]
MRRLPDLPTFRTPKLPTKLSSRVASLSPGDRLIAGVLALVLAGIALAGVYAFERQFLVDVPSRGGQLTEGVEGHPRFINPLLALTDADRDLATLTYAGLMGYDQDGVLAPVLAESYEISEDGKVYTFRLRDTVRFSDGTPVTADDVVFTVMKAQDPGLLSPRLADWANIRAEAVDARTVRFTLPKAYAPFLEDATLGILPARIWRNITNEEFPFSPYMTEPVGAGPFKVVGVIRDKNGIIERYELAANRFYALGHPYLSRMTFVYFDTEEDLREALLRGRVESAQGIPGPEARTAPYSRVFGIFFNASKNPNFQKIEVRKALSQAIDREALIAQMLGGYGQVATGPVPPGLISATTTPEGDPTTLAADTLERNDWNYDAAARAWTNDGATLSVTLATANVPELRAIAEQVRSDFEQVGIETTVELHDPNDLIVNVIRPRNYEALLFGMVVGKDQDLFAFWDSSQRNDPGLNVALYANRSVDDLLEKIRTDTDPATRAHDLQELNDLIAADYPAAFTHAPAFLYSLPEDVQGVVLGTVSEPSDRFLTAAFWYRHTEAVWPFLANSR